jgi:hypothetical protein
MNPVILHVVRPYASEEVFLAAEAWTIDARGMVLLDQQNLEPETAVVFDVSLSNGVKLIRAEGRVAGYLAPSDDRPGGLRIRFRRFGGQTKSFIDRAIAARELELSASVSSRPPPPGPGSTPKPLLLPEQPPLPMERSGIHRRPLMPVDAPPNRDELLDRLRARSAATRDEARTPEHDAENG